MLAKLTPCARLLSALMLAVALPHQLSAAGPAPVNLRTTSGFVILSGAGITSTGGGLINGNVGASPIAGSAIGVTCAQVTGTIYAVDASGPACAVIDAARLTTAKGDLTTAYNDAAGRTPIPSGPNLNPGLIPGSGNIGGMNLAPGLYKFTTTALITGADVTLTGGAEDVWIFQCAQDLQLGSGLRVILAGGAQAKNIFWQVGTSAVLGTSSVFKGTILADQSITMNTSSTMDGRALASSAGVVFNGSGAAVALAPEIGVQQPPGDNLVDGVSSKDFGAVLVGASTSFIFTITNSGDANLTGLGMTVDGADPALFTVTANPVAPVAASGSTTFTVRFAPLTPGAKSAVVHITSNDTDESPFDIVLTGSGAAAAVPEIAVAQPAGTGLVDGVSSRDFGLVLTGANSSLTFTVTNTGTASLTGLGITIDGVDAAQFSVTAAPGPTVIPNGSTTFTVRFAPLSGGVKTAGLHLSNNDPDESPFDITLTGTGSAIAFPEIAVAQPAGSDLVDGVSSRSFGAVLAGASTSLIFTITNTGTANLTGLGITIDGADAAQFSVTTSPVAPVTPGGSTTFIVRFAPLSVGVKTAALHLASNDADEGSFDIALTGTGSAVPVPELAVEQPAGTDLVDGASTRDFGLVIAGATSSLTFTITNTGTANLTGLGITVDGVDAALFSVTASPAAPVIPAGGTIFTVRFSPLSSGLKTAALHLASNDADESPFDILLTGTGTAGALVASTNVLVIAVSPITLNPQTGLFEQTVRLTNSGISSVPAVRLIIQTLPLDVQVHNASGSTNGMPYVQHNFPLAASATVDFLIEYYRSSRLAIPQPAFVAEEAAVVLAAATGPVLVINPQRAPMQAGRFFIEFPTTPGRSYAVQYSSDMTTWKTASPTLAPVNDRMQWYDDGPPKTESLPASLGSRFYRVIQLP